MKSVPNCYEHSGYSFFCLFFKYLDVVYTTGSPKGARYDVNVFNNRKVLVHMVVDIVQFFVFVEVVLRLTQHLVVYTDILLG